MKNPFGHFLPDPKTHPSWFKQGPTPTPAPEPVRVPDEPPPPPFVPRVLVSMPRYGLVNPEAMIAKLIPSSWAVPPEDRVELFGQADCNTSLLPHAFNEILKEAFVLRDAGKLTHLAMLHSDTAPLGYWLNDLWRLMRDGKLAAISAVSPIKDHWSDRAFAGRTSTAFGLRDDPWSVPRVIRLEDRAKMLEAGLETFGPADVCQAGEVLLINTACMLLDLRHPCWDVPCYEGEGDHFAFSFRNRIRRDPHTRDYSAWVRPEDWEMARHLDRAGAPYAATWKVRLKHYGLDYWTNYPEEPSPPPPGG